MNPDLILNIVLKNLDTSFLLFSKDRDSGEYVIADKSTDLYELFRIKHIVLYDLKSALLKFDINKELSQKIKQDDFATYKAEINYSKLLKSYIEPVFEKFEDKLLLILKRTDAKASRELMLDELSKQVPGTIYQYQYYPDGKSRFPYASRGIFDIYEVTPEEVEHDASIVFSRLHPDDIEAVSKSIALSFENLTLWEYEYRVVLPSKGERWLRGTANPQKMPDGSVLWHGYIHDITERIQITNELQAERDLFSAGPVVTIIWESRENWPVKYVSSNIKEVLKYTRQDFTNPNFKYSEIIHPEDIEFVSEEVRLNITADINTYEQSYRIKNGNGEYIWIFDYTRIIRDVDNSIKEIRGYLINQTNLVEAISKIKDQNERLGFILEGTNSGTWEWNVQTGEVIFNDRWSEIVGYTLEELSPISIETWMNLTHPEDLMRSTELIKKHFDGEIEFYELEARMKHKDGHWVWISDRGKLLSRSSNGEPLWMFGTHIDITARKEEEIENQKTKIALELAAKGTNDGLWLWNLENNSLEVSERWKEILGITQDTEINKHSDFLDLVYEEDKPILQQDIEALLKKGKSKIEIQFRMKHTDGRVIWVLSKGEIFKNEEQQHFSIGGSISDITKRKEMEDMLISSEQNFRLFFDSMDDLIFIGRPNGEIIYTNNAVEKKLGYNLEELTNLGILGVHPPEKRDEATVIFGDMINGLRDSCPLPLQAKSGHYIPVETKIWFGTWNKEDVIFGISKDLTFQQEALEKFNKLFENNPALMAVSELPSRTFAEVNSAFLDTLGYSKAEIIGKSASDIDLFVSADQQQLIASVLEKHGKISGVELDIKTKSGKILTGLFAGEIIEDQRSKYFLTVMTDITAQKKAESELLIAKQNAENANKAKSEFIANMSHEIRTPMNSILGFTELMLNTTENAQHHEYLRTVLKSGETLLHLINDILDLSKIESGKFDITHEPVSITRMIKELISMFSKSAKDKAVDLIYEIDSEVPLYIISDEIRLRQILLNLIGNALKFTEYGYVKVHFGAFENQEGRYDISIRVLDTGIGISDSFQEIIFDAFSQQSGQDSKKYAGTGLGLAITKRLCTAMGGDIQLKSKENEGSEFIVTLSNIEVSPLDSNPDDIFSWEDGEIVFEAAKILLVDDIYDNRFLLKSFLMNYNFDFIEATNGREAVEMVEKFQPDIVLMDLKMPVMSGIQATQIIKNERTQKIPKVIAITAAADWESDDYREDLFDAYLRKPVQKNQIISQLMKFLKYQIKINIKSNEDAIETDDTMFQIIPKSVSSEFRQIFGAKIDELLEMFIDDEMMLFADAFSQFAIKHKLIYWEKVAKILVEAINEYDIDKTVSIIEGIKSNFE